MPRQKNVPDVVSRKMELAHQLKQIRMELFGQRGGPELARRLNLPTRTWYNYEKGVTIPGETLLDFLSLTRVSLERFCDGITEKSEPLSHESHRARLAISAQDHSVDSLNGKQTPVRKVQDTPVAQMVVQTIDTSMMPSLPPGTLIGLGDRVEPAEFSEIEGQIVVAWHLETPIARRLVFAGQNWLLEADQAGWPAIFPLKDSANVTTIQRVLWFLRPAKTEKRPTVNSL